MIIGFTGTREGLTPAQASSLLWEMRTLTFDQPYLEGHHGDCLGGDATFHNICRELSFDNIVVHPPADIKLRAFCYGDKVLKSKPYSERNKDIVDVSEYVIGAPNSKIFQPRGGTYQTIRLAQTKGNLWKIVFPDGSVVKG